MTNVKKGLELRKTGSKGNTHGKWKPQSSRFDSRCQEGCGYNCFRKAAATLILLSKIHEGKELRYFFKQAFVEANSDTNTMSSRFLPHRGIDNHKNFRPDIRQWMLCFCWSSRVTPISLPKPARQPPLQPGLRQVRSGCFTRRAPPDFIPPSLDGEWRIRFGAASHRRAELA